MHAAAAQRMAYIAQGASAAGLQILRQGALGVGQRLSRSARKHGDLRPFLCVRLACRLLRNKLLENHVRVAAAEAKGADSCDASLPTGVQLPLHLFLGDMEGEFRPRDERTLSFKVEMTGNLPVLKR